MTRTIDTSTENALELARDLAVWGSAPAPRGARLTIDNGPRELTCERVTLRLASGEKITCEGEHLVEAVLVALFHLSRLS